MLLNDPTHSHNPPPKTPLSVSGAHLHLRPRISHAPSAGIRNLILNQLHIRNLVSLGYMAGDTGSRIRGGLARSLTPEAFFLGYREGGGGGVDEGEEAAEVAKKLKGGWS